jgi:hypothetical protein
MNGPCVICGVSFEEYGHSTEPIKRGRCCNICNDAIIIPARIRIMRQSQDQEAQENESNSSLCR